MEDVARVDERVRKLQGHFGQAAKDIDDILVSTSKVTKRGQKIESLEFAAPTAGDAQSEAPADPRRRTADSKTGQLRLRVVEDGE
jgi:DNA recombination protein RmuC